MWNQIIQKKRFNQNFARFYERHTMWLCQECFSKRFADSGVNVVSRQRWRCPQRQSPGALCPCTSGCPIGCRPHGAARCRSGWGRVSIMALSFSLLASLLNLLIVAGGYFVAPQSVCNVLRTPDGYFPGKVHLNRTSSALLSRRRCRTIMVVSKEISLSLGTFNEASPEVLVRFRL